MTTASRRRLPDDRTRTGETRCAASAQDVGKMSSGQNVHELPGFADAVAALRDGGLVVYPTETLYALGASYADDVALRRLVSLKGREPNKPIAVIIGDVAMLDMLVTGISGTARVLMERFWPGPLTIVFPARDSLAEELTGGQGSIGVRLSSHPIARALSRAVRAPITAPSANPAGHKAPRRIEEAGVYFGKDVDAYLDGGVLTGEPPSSLVDARCALSVLRTGAIPEKALRAAVQEVR